MFKFLCLAASLFGATVAQGGFQKVGIQQHNFYREKHGGPNVSGETALHMSAQTWADFLARTDKFEHSKGPYGENIYKAWGGSKDLGEQVKKAMASWYGEIKSYDFNNPGFKAGTGHFTQLVWKDSTKIGIGASLKADVKWGHIVVIVAQYNPPGNVVTADNSFFKRNVLRPK